MATKIESNLDDLRINRLSKDQFKTALKNGEIIENELYAFPASPTVNFNRVYVNKTIATTTSLEYTSVYITIPANSYYSLYAVAMYNVSKPEVIMISDSIDNHNGYPYAAGNVAHNHASTAWSGFATEDTTFCVWTKYQTAGNNNIIIDGFYATIDNM